LHVDAVNIGAFFAVNFDVDETLIREGGSFGVFKRLVRHNVAPVTCRVTYAEKNGLVFNSGFCQSLIAPRIPVNGVVGVLE
jgi:hypothetical protein